MTFPLRLPSRRGYSPNDRAIEHWAREHQSDSAAHGDHGASHAIDGTDPIGFPVFLGRAKVQAATNATAVADGWEDWGGATPLSVVVTKRLAATRLLVTYGFSAFHTTAGGQQFHFAIHESVTATRYDQHDAAYNTASQHQGWDGSALISGLAAGAHTLKLQVDVDTDSLSTNSADYGHIEVWEVP